MAVAPFVPFGTVYRFASQFGLSGRCAPRQQQFSGVASSSACVKRLRVGTGSGVAVALPGLQFGQAEQVGHSCLGTLFQNLEPHFGHLAGAVLVREIHL